MVAMADGVPDVIQIEKWSLAEQLICSGSWRFGQDNN